MIETRRHWCERCKKVVDSTRTMEDNLFSRAFDIWTHYLKPFGAVGGIPFRCPTCNGITRKNKIGFWAVSIAIMLALVLMILAKAAYQSITGK